MTISGLPWCQTPKTISAKAFASRILCTEHNSQLSDVDQAGAEALEWLSRVTQVASIRQVEGRKQGRRLRYSVDGHKFERWLLKCIVGVAYRHETDEQELWRPPIEWVEQVFGSRALLAGAGLFVGAIPAYAQPVETNRLSVDCLSHENEQGGALFTLNGIRVALSLLPTSFEGMTHRPSFLRDRVGLTTYQVVRFDWGDASAA